MIPIGMENSCGHYYLFHLNVFICIYSLSIIFFICFDVSCLSFPEIIHKYFGFILICP